ncbi:hypothetical protein DL93DRAFT_2073830 [Clavulina sp. PMI_390]|nr:hypothetical protein DL93DRAFT_2073830 [Clavulina sp. PMI_390]
MTKPYGVCLFAFIALMSFLLRSLPCSRHLPHEESAGSRSKLPYTTISSGEQATPSRPSDLAVRIEHSLNISLKTELILHIFRAFPRKPSG